MGKIINKNWFTVKKLLPQIWGIAEFGHNEKVISYLFVGKKEALLFDTGMGIGDINREVRKITSNKIIVVNSHCHYDHIGGNVNFCNINLYNDIVSKRISGSGYSNKSILKYFQNKYFLKKPPSSFSKMKFKIMPFKYQRLLNNGDQIKISPFCFSVIHTPGHTPDSICLYEKKSQILLSGDTLYLGPIFLHLKEASTSDYIKSITKLISLKIKVILPGHNTFKLKPYYLILIKEVLAVKKMQENFEVTKIYL